jgi:hypothetical protein
MPDAGKTIKLDKILSVLHRLELEPVLVVVIMAALIFEES